MGNGTSIEPKLISIVGLSGSGKTTLVEKLIRELKWRGLNIGTIKHSSHPHPMDMPGKDSWRHREAGAERTLFVGPSSLQLVCSISGNEKPVELARRFHSGLDLVIVEGFLNEEGEKIEVVRSERSKEPVCEAADGLIAIASDMSAKELGIDGLPVFSLDDIEGVIDFIVDHFSFDIARSEKK